MITWIPMLDLLLLYPVIPNLTWSLTIQPIVQFLNIKIVYDSNPTKNLFSSTFQDIFPV